MEILWKTLTFQKQKVCPGENRNAHKMWQVCWKQETKKLKTDMQSTLKKMLQLVEEHALKPSKAERQLGLEGMPRV